MLLEEGFKVTSVDASDKMLKQALKFRWENRKQDIFDKWGMYQICNCKIDFHDLNFFYARILHETLKKIMK